MAKSMSLTDASTSVLAPEASYQMLVSPFKFKEIDLSSLPATPHVAVSKQRITPTAGHKKVTIEAHPINISWEDDTSIHPYNWPSKKKWLTCLTVTTFTFSSACTAAGYPLSLEGFKDEYQVSDHLYMFGHSFWLLGMAFAPFIAAPWSESVGRYPILMVSCLGSLLLVLGQALANNIETVLITKLLQGVIGSASFSVSAGAICDVFQEKERGVAFGFHLLFSFSGYSLIPTSSVWIAYRMGWRSVFWIQGAIGLISFFLFLLFLDETRPDVLLSRRAKRLTLLTGIAHRARANEGNPHGGTTFASKCPRPVKMLVTDPILLLLSIWMAFTWCIWSVMYATIPLTFAYYGWNHGLCHLPQISSLIGMSLALLSYVIGQDRHYQRISKFSKGDKPAPENRLASAALGTMNFASGACLLSLAMHLKPLWIFPAIAIALLNFGFFLMVLSGYTYLSDTYNIFFASALAVSGCLQNVLVSITPPLALDCFLRSRTLAIIVMVVTPLLGVFPWLFLWKGKEIRLSSVQASIVAKLGEGKSLDNVLPHETDTEDAVDTDDGKVRSTCLSSHTCLEGQICRAEKSDIPIMLKY